MKRNSKYINLLMIIVKDFFYKMMNVKFFFLTNLMTVKLNIGVCVIWILFLRIVIRSILGLQLETMLRKKKQLEAMLMLHIG
jgi:uncharacterized membrane protein